tara:strand:- start:330 stop:485 length:156 start_codon:yes stop_codon:yes gene_type:complete
MLLLNELIKSGGTPISKLFTNNASKIFGSKKKVADNLTTSALFKKKYTTLG